MDRPTPALIVCDSSTGRLRIAALTLLDRLVVTLHRAGCAPVQIVCKSELPELRRARALRISTVLLREIPPIQQPTLVATSDLLVQAADVRRVVQGSARLVNDAGERLPLGIVTRFESDVVAALADAPQVPAEGLAERVTDAASARRAEARLWGTMGSSSDGLVDTYFNRPLGRFLSKLLVHTPVTPNQVTIVSALIGLVAAYYFSVGEYWAGITAALLLQLSALVDCIDGELARIVFKESPIGKWLDIGLDQVVHVAVFAAIAVGLSRQGTDAPVLWLGASAVAGALISFPVVVRGRLVGNQDTRLERFIDAASTRDFTALLVVLACVNKLEWFLWLTAILVHVFWVTALFLQSPGKKSAVPVVRPSA